MMPFKNILIYPFGWLDEIIEIRLNPRHADAMAIGEEQVHVLQQEVPLELRRVWNSLKSQTFLILTQKRVQAIVIQYHDNLGQLHRQTLANMAGYPEGHPLNSLCGAILVQVESLQGQLRDRYGSYLAKEQVVSRQDPHPSEVLFKVMCHLSVDQIAIILKAADDIRLLTASSFSLVLRSITPFLSTERMKSFSWKSARTSTTKVEDHDKHVAIESLEALIRKIKTY
jgi:hypothetical protein